MRNCFWSLYNIVDRIRIDGLSTVQLGGLLKTFARQTLDEWLVWEEGASDWREAGEVSQDFEKAELKLALHPPTSVTGTATPLATAAAATESQITNTSKSEILKTTSATSTGTDGKSEADRQSAISLEVSINMRTEQRSSTRYPHHFKVTLRVGAQVQQNETADISIDGMKLKQPIPDSMEGLLEVSLHNGKRELQMTARAVRASGEKNKTRLMIEWCDFKDVLQKWLISGPLL